MSQRPWGGDEAFRRELAALTKTRLKLRVSAGALIAIAAGSHVLEGLVYGTLPSKGVALFALLFGLYVAAHYSMLLVAKRALSA